MVGVVDVDRTAQAATVVGCAAAPVEAHIVSQKNGNGAEIHLPEAWRIELKTIPKYKGMAGRRAAKRSRGSASRTVGLDENWAVLDEQIGEIGGAFGLQHKGIQLLRHQRF